MECCEIGVVVEESADGVHFDEVGRAEKAAGLDPTHQGPLPPGGVGTELEIALRPTAGASDAPLVLRVRILKGE